MLLLLWTGPTYQVYTAPSFRDTKSLWYIGGIWSDMVDIKIENFHHTIFSPMGVEQSRGGQGVIIYTSDMLLRTHAQGNKGQGHWRVGADNPRVFPDNRQAFGQYPGKTKRDLCLVLKRWIF